MTGEILSLNYKEGWEDLSKRIAKIIPHRKSGGLEYAYL
jgi:hypothetical protein